MLNLIVMVMAMVMVMVMVKVMVMEMESVIAVTMSMCVCIDSIIRIVGDGSVCEQLCQLSECRKSIRFNE